MTIYPPRLRISYDVTCGAADSGSRAGSTQCQANGRRHKQRPEGGDLRNDVKLQPMTGETVKPNILRFPTKNTSMKHLEAGETSCRESSQFIRSSEVNEAKVPPSQQQLYFQNLPWFWKHFEWFTTFTSFRTFQSATRRL